MPSNRLTEEFKRQLDGRTKRQLIEGMIVRSPNNVATEKMVKALEVYPLLILMLAHDHPVKIWILDRGEAPSSAEILDEAAKNRRWHSNRICVDECEGLTDVVDNYVAVVVSWKTLLVMRHEFAHAATTFIGPSVRQELERLFREARQRRQFVEPLAAESLGEYIACGMSYYFFPDLREELQQTDPALHDLVAEMLRQAEVVSEDMVAEPIAAESDEAVPVPAIQA